MTYRITENQYNPPSMYLRPANANQMNTKKYACWRKKSFTNYMGRKMCTNVLAQLVFNQSFFLTRYVSYLKLWCIIKSYEINIATTQSYLLYWIVFNSFNNIPLKIRFTIYHFLINILLVQASGYFAPVMKIYQSMIGISQIIFKPLSILLIFSNLVAS